MNFVDGRASGYSGEGEGGGEADRKEVRVSGRESGREWEGDGEKDMSCHVQLLLSFRVALPHHRNIVICTNLYLLYSCANYSICIFIKI